MKKAALAGTIVLAALALLCSLAGGQEDMVSVDNSVFASPRRPPAVFRHEEHNENAGLDDCSRCHHLYDEKGNKLEDESSEDQSCSECHGTSDENGRPSLRKAFHLNCKGCHLELKQGPVTCGSCHRWNTGQEQQKS